MAERWPRDGREMAERWPGDGREVAERWPRDGRDGREMAERWPRDGRETAERRPGDGREIAGRVRAETASCLTTCLTASTTPSRAVSSSWFWRSCRTASMSLESLRDGTIPPEYRIQCGFSPVGGAVASTSLERLRDDTPTSGIRHRVKSEGIQPRGAEECVPSRALRWSTRIRRSASSDESSSRLRSEARGMTSVWWTTWGVSRKCRGGSG